ncbi:sugar phosphate isomerase/epimerase [Paenibacillus sp. FSL H7-0331]|uniref:sugar phosphate isomerase/epimerase family protein n=1 Tax=Paenibacillus sp. FSL H7-0331 TaxID=1920421 RepID=UPI00096BED46|nr:sugar phosphate isomerase/epimerase family protein [Paenibacillus sp. FSL H7-0331]OMF18233.1 xylose isomerase [Paenibacillus sp. FSL H7-0331]
MKLSFTTLGCPEWELDLIIDRAVEYGFDAIDFRGVSGEMNIYKLPAFSVDALQTRDQIKAAGLQVSCFSSSVHVFSKENFEKNVAEIKEYVKLCTIFNTRYIRVFGGAIGDTDRAEAVHTMVQHFQELGALAKAHGVKLLLETHDDWTASADVQAVMEQVDTEAIAVLWDLHHPVRTLGEQPTDTWQSLSPWVEYTHVKDSKLLPHTDGQFQYCLTGEGDMPLVDTIKLLLENGYDGYFTFEWEKKWHPEILNAEESFPQYVQFMRALA